jgi:hypothetical protein
MVCACLCVCVFAGKQGKQLRCHPRHFALHIRLVVPLHRWKRFWSTMRESNLTQGTYLSREFFRTAVVAVAHGSHMLACFRWPQEAKLVPLCRTVLPQWADVAAPDDAFVPARLYGGLTNLMFTVTAPEGVVPSRAVVRVAPVLRNPDVKKSRRKSEEEKHSILKHPQALFFDRALELQVLQLASARNISARLWGSGVIEVVENRGREHAVVTKLARVEEWIEGDTLTSLDLRSDDVLLEIASVLRLLHDSPVSALFPDEGDDGNDETEAGRLADSSGAAGSGVLSVSEGKQLACSAVAQTSTSPLECTGSPMATRFRAVQQSDTQLHHLLHLFHDLISLSKDVTADEEDKYGVGVPAARAVDKEYDLGAEVAWMLAAADASSSPLRVVHNDAQPGNWIRGHASLGGKRRLFLIDYEYAGLNYRGFEFGNLFCEFCFDYNHAEAPYFLYTPEQYPSRDTQARFFREYLSTSGSSLSGE